MGTPFIAGFVYFAIVFAAGFAFGTIRALLTAEAPSASLMAVVIELPIILAFAWFACLRTVAWFAVSATVAARATMGAVAFGLLIAGEFAIGVALLGRTVGEHFATYGEASHALGLAGQAVFALFPVVQRRFGATSPR
jgi:hypothetical protein